MRTVEAPGGVSGRGETEAKEADGGGLILRMWGDYSRPQGRWFPSNRRNRSRPLSRPNLSPESSGRESLEIRHS